MDNNIPKVIHYCWFGKGKKSKLILKCIDSWKKKCPDYKIVEWNESNFDVNINNYVSQAYSQKKWAFVSDYARLWIVYNYGGIYLDTDVELVKTLNDLLKYDLFLSTEDNKYINTGLGFGAKKYNNVIKKILDSYENINFINNDGSLDMTPCPYRNTKTVEELFNMLVSQNIDKYENGYILLNKNYFCPYEAMTGQLYLTDKTHGIHWFNASWESTHTKLKGKILRPLKRLIGKENVMKLKNKFNMNHDINIENNDVAVITIYDLNNYGNRLQSYAVNHVLKKVNMNPVFLIDNDEFILYKIKKNIKKILKKSIPKEENENRMDLFKKFSSDIVYLKSINGFLNPKISKQDIGKYKYFVTGSDQVWNLGPRGLHNKFLLSGVTNKKRISFSASFGISSIPEKYQKKVSKELAGFNMISVREDVGKKIIEDLTDRKDIEVLIDPTMLLTCEEWDKVAKKPKQLKNDKYILTYFLGDLSKERNDEINRIARENNCEIINILDKNSIFYETGPSEFLYLEKHAFLICTDSFHSSVFAILYNRPFIVFDREDKIANMNSRIDTLLSKFKLKNRKFEGKITSENLQHDYTEAYKILEEERKKAKDFVEKALNIEK